MSRIAKVDVNAALERAAKNITDAAGRDGVASRADVKAKVATLTGTEKALTDCFFRFIDARDFKTNARVTKGDVTRALDYAKEHLLAKYDVNHNGFSKSEVAKMSVTGQLATTLAAELKGVAPLTPGPATSALGKLFETAAKDTYYMSESDSQPAFISTPYAASKALTGASIMAAFNDKLAAYFDENSGNLSGYIAEMEGPAESTAFLKGMAEFEATDEDYVKDNAKGFARIKKVFDDNLTDVRVVRVGPRDENDHSKMGSDQGAYQYLVVGRTADGKLAGVQFESVET